MFYCRCIDDRLDAIAEIVGTDSVFLRKIRAVISNLPDLEKALTSIIHGKVSSVVFISFFKHKTVATAQGKQGIWKSIFPDRENTGNLPKILKIWFYTGNLTSTQGKFGGEKKNNELVI